MKLGQKQEKFMHMYMLLLFFIHENGYRVRQKNPLNCKVVHERCLHNAALAQDLFIRRVHPGAELLKKSDDYLFAGEFWESIGGSWGGRSNDCCHFSLTHGGMI